MLTKKSHHAINIISGISVCGVAISTAALICILSVFNGFQDMVANLFTAFDPELKVIPAEGKFMSADSKELNTLKKNPQIAIYSEVLQDNALLMINNRQVMATIKGVDDNFEQLVDFDRIKFGDGVFELHADVIEYGIFGVNLLSALGVDTDFPSPIQVYAPRGGERIDMNDPSESFNQDELYSPNVAFCVKQQKYDSNYVITSIRFSRHLFERYNMVSSIELKLKDGADINRIKNEISNQLGTKYVVKDRYEQQEDTFKIMKIEKLISYIFLTFIIMIACFNIIGSISMLIIDKKDDAVILRNLGATEHQIANIFMIEGRMISLLGAITGIALGLILCLLQQYFGIIKFGQSAGSYIIDSYPVSVHLMDVIAVFVTVIIVGFISVWYPVRQLSKKYTSALALLLVCLFVSCGPGDNRFKIKGSFEGMPSGQLFIYNFGDETANFDTVNINNGEFVYGGTVNELTPYILVFPNALEQIIFVDKGKEIKYKASASDLKNYYVDGNDENILMNDFRKSTKDLVGLQVQKIAGQFINKHSSSAVAVYLFDRYFVQDEYTPIATLKSKLKILKRNNPHNKFILTVENNLKMIEAGQIGKKLPDIVINTRLKHKINIQKVNSDYTALVFWASWIPDQYGFMNKFSNISKEYSLNNKIKIFAISLDTEIYKWEDLIKEDTVYCEQTCDGQAWESPIIKKLGITTIPTFIIADKRHRIISRGNSLDALRENLDKFAK